MYKKERFIYIFIGKFLFNSFFIKTTYILNLKLSYTIKYYCSLITQASSIRHAKKYVLKASFDISDSDDTITAFKFRARLTLIRRNNDTEL